MEQEKEQNMEAKILQIAEEQFLKKGYAMTSLSEIAKLANCNHALLHYYFRTKEKLFSRIFYEKTKLFMSVLMEEDDSSQDFLTKMRHKIEQYYDLLQENQNIPFLLINELLTNPERVKLIHENENFEKLQSHIMPAFANEVDQAIARGEIRPITAFNLLFDVLSLCAFTMLALPILQDVFQMSQEAKLAFLEQRKKSIVDTVLNSLRP